MPLFRFPAALAAAFAICLGLAPEAQAQSADCKAKFDELMNVRISTIKQIQGIAERNKKKPSIENAKSACSTFGTLISADENLVSFMESEGSWCGISEDVQGQAKAALANSKKERTATCNVVASAERQRGQAVAANSCNTDFERLTKARAGTLAQLTRLSAAQKKNATPQRVIQACSLLNTLVSREASLNSWVKNNTKRCGIPGKIRTQLANASSASRKSRSEACSVAKQIKEGGARAQAAAQRPQNFDPTSGGPGVPSTPGGGVRLPSGAL
jgi:hypothetical protein